jgi:hypothetical protein
MAACASKAPAVRVDRDANTNFANYKSFGWLATDKAVTTSLTEERIRSAVVASLQSKGYVFDERSADFRVAFTLNTYEKPKEGGMRIGLGAGGGSGNVGGGVGVSFPIGKRHIMAGTLTLDIIDAGRNAQVWTGSYESRVEADELAESTAQKLVSTVLEKFPSHGAIK